MAGVLQKLRNIRSRRQKAKKIRLMSREAERIAQEARRGTNAATRAKINRMMASKAEILRSHTKGERSELKDRIVEQILTLVISYLKLLDHFSLRSRELDRTDVTQIGARISGNGRKLSFARDERMTEELRRVIGMDEKLLARLKNEKKELERLSAKLDYMESTVGMLRHRILTSIENEDVLEELEKAVMEAEALDAALEDRRRNRLRR